METPSIQDILDGELKDLPPNQDLQFLTAFIEDKEGTPASRLAKYATIFSNSVLFLVVYLVVDFMPWCNVLAHCLFACLFVCLSLVLFWCQVAAT